mmetsp:Transcript_100326/g.321705  ORF Transcript_100326/g.321705 Transcript_100326/m.321705 type:complete len:380 (-) Transcript_100326:35-1174(-)
MSEGGLRRRNVPVADDGGSKTQRAFEKLKSFDVYSKVHDDYLQKSQTGGAVSLVTAMILAFLFWAELAEFTSAEVEHSFSVDTSFTRRLPVSMNITLPSLRCDMVSVDTVDSKGESQLNVRGSMGRENLDRSGRFVPERVPKPGECLDCLEGAGEEHACCNTCSELKDAYVVKNLSYAHILESSEQCGAAVGCRIVGSIMVSKCSGNVHIALGESRLKGRALVHRFNVQDIAQNLINTSHIIHSISFGEPVPGAVSPLDGTVKIVKHGAYMFHYHIKLVPTEFTDRYGVRVETNQYSFTDVARNVHVRNGEMNGLPGIFIVYDIYPFLMKSTEKVKPWSYIFTSSCALIGGVFSVASLVEMFASRAIGQLFGCKPGISL